MKRRAFILLGGAAVVWPLAARAQQPPTPVIGYLSARSPDDTWHLVEAFRRGLREAGFVEGQNATIEYRWGLGERGRLAGLASDLVRKPVSVLVTTGGESAALEAKAATSTIPIAFIIGGDPVKLGLSASYSRPGANATGITILTATLEPKRLELLRELVPQASTIGAFLDPNFPPYDDQLRDLREAARTLDLQLHELRASTIYRVSAFRDGLKEAGFIDGHNVAIEFRWAENKLDQLPPLAADLAQRQVAVIVGPNASMRAARAVTSTIPIVFISGGDPIASGLVPNLSRPGGSRSEEHNV